jgi:hypothetical protein
MLKGYEVGLPLTASFEFIQVIQGKPTLSPRGVLALIHQSNAAEVRTTRLTDNGLFIGYECWMKRHDSGFEYTVRFTMDDAKRADLVRPESGWEHYPENMCLWRSVGFCADVAVPDIIGGMRRVDEYDAPITPDGDLVEAEYVIAIAPPPTLDALVAQFGADAILAASGGAIPATAEELSIVAAALATPAENSDE